MAAKFGLLKFLLILGLVDKAFLSPASAPRSPSTAIQELESKLLEIKLPVKITSMDDLIAWAKNAMRSMASRIDITLATIDESEDGKNGENMKSTIGKTRLKQRGPISDTSQENKRPLASAGALVSTYASLFGAGNPFESTVVDENDFVKKDLPRRGNDDSQDVLSRANLNAFLPLFLDHTDISKYRDEALRNYYLKIDEANREKSKIDILEKNAAKYSRAVAQQTSKVPVGNERIKISQLKKSDDEKKTKPVISVPFEAIVTITRENEPGPSRASFTETRDPPDDFPPYFETDYSRPQVGQKIKSDTTKKMKDNSQKSQTALLGSILRALGLTKKVTNTKINSISGTQLNKPRKPSQFFTPPPRFQFEDEDQHQRRNETSQKQEFDDDEEEEEPMGSLGSITDLLPLVIPILEDIIDPNTETDLGEVLAAALPLIQGLSDPNDEDAPDIIGMIGPILTNILAGKDGQGSDVAAILGPLVTLVAPLIGPVLGPIVGPLLTASSNPPQGEGSSLATLISAVLAPLVQPTEPGGMSPLAVLTAGVIAALSKELKPGLPGGLDVGALVGAVLSGVIAGTSAGLSGSLSDNNRDQSYVPYGAGPVQAGSVNSGTNAGFSAPVLQQQNRPIHTPGNVGENQRIVHHTTRRPYSTLPQNIPPALQARPPPTTYNQHIHANGPLQTGIAYAGTEGGSSYLPYGTNAVPASSPNPIALIGGAIKDVLGAGIQVVSSVINAVFGIFGSSSSSDEPRPVYGPPHQRSFDHIHS